MTIRAVEKRTEHMRIGDGYGIYAQHGTRELTALHFHESGELFPYATNGASPTETEIEKTFHDLFNGNLEEADIYAMDTWGGTDNEGTAIDIERSMFENEISQELSAIEELIVGEKAKVKFKIKETPIERVAMLLGNLVGDVATLSTLPNWIGVGDVATVKRLLIGGLSTIPFLSYCTRILKNRSAVEGETLYEYYYFPNCQVDPNTSIKRVKNDIFMMDVVLNVRPSAQLHELTAGVYTFTDPANTKVYHTMRSREGKGALGMIYEEFGS